MRASIFACLGGALLAMAAPPQPAAGKSYYTIIPKPGIDTKEAINFVKTTVGAEDLRPWTDVHEKLISWTVEASDKEVAAIKDHASIAKVTKMEVS